MSATLLPLYIEIALCISNLYPTTKIYAHISTVLYSNIIQTDRFKSNTLGNKDAQYIAIAVKIHINMLPMSYCMGYFLLLRTKFNNIHVPYPACLSLEKVDSQRIKKWKN